VAVSAREVGFEVVGPNQIFDVKEGGTFLTHVDERGLHAG
jgi:hypothetical protein